MRRVCFCLLAIPETNCILWVYVYDQNMIRTDLKPLYAKFHYSDLQGSLNIEWALCNRRGSIPRPPMDTKVCMHSNPCIWAIPQSLTFPELWLRKGPATFLKHTEAVHNCPHPLCASECPLGPKVSGLRKFSWPHWSTDPVGFRMFRWAHPRGVIQHPQIFKSDVKPADNTGPLCWVFLMEFSPSIVLWVVAIGLYTEDHAQLRSYTEKVSAHS